MPNYRRAYVPGGTYFFTVVTYQRRPLFDVELNRTRLGDVIRSCQSEFPFTIDAMVLLPDHLHSIWTLPTGDANFSKRWGIIKLSFTQWYLASGQIAARTTDGQQRDQRRGIWQPHFWEHSIEDEADFDAHFDYIHFNPVKHGLVKCPSDWTASSFHRWVRAGVYPADWGCGQHPSPINSQIRHDFGEPG